jgi:leader peptidase (prepilin peptidase)/N-methyltransferase
MPAMHNFASAPAIAVAELVLGGLVCVALSRFDLRRRILPNELVLVLAGCGVGFHAATGWLLLSPWDSLSGALSAIVALLLLRALYRAARGASGLGLGDVKLAGAAGVWIGWAEIPWLVALAALLSLLVIPWRCGTGLRAAVPFGPALCLALSVLMAAQLAG